MNRRVTLLDAQTLVGLTYVDGEFDCMHLALLAQQQLFGRSVGWPLDARHPRGVRSQAAVIARHRDELAQPVDDPTTGDAVLFTEDDGRGGRRWHVGTLFVQHGERWVLHTNARVGASILQRLAECPREGLRLEGFYRWIEKGAA